MQYTGGTGDRLPIQEFNTTEELLNLPIFIDLAKKHGFTYFAKSFDVIYYVGDHGFERSIMGSIKYINNVDLPQLEGWKFHARLANGSITVLTSEVAKRMKDVLYLHDGTTAIDLDYKH